MDVVGTEFDDDLTGTVDNDSLFGLGGDDTLNGGAGADTLDGGFGNDLFMLNDADTIVEAAGAGFDTVQAAFSYTLGSNLEQLILTGTASINGLGNTLNNILIGNSGNNILNGGTGADTMYGGLGNDIYVVDNAGDVIFDWAPIKRVSTSSAGVAGNSYSWSPDLSGTGRYAIFESDADNLVAGDTNGYRDIFVKDMQTGVTTRVSTSSGGAQGNNESFDANTSSDGRYVVFISDASNLVAGDTNGVWDTFVKDLQTGVTKRVSTSATGVEGDGFGFNADISANGRYVVFESNSSNLVAGDTNFSMDIFWKDLQTGAIKRISTGSSGSGANGTSENPGVSDDGRYVVFESDATNLVAGGTSGVTHAYVKDTLTGSIRLASVTSSGTQPNSDIEGAVISGNGRFVVFSSHADNLGVGGTNIHLDVFVKDLQTGVIRCASTSASGASGNFWSQSADISADGRYVVFESFANNLVAGDTNDDEDIFVKDMQTGAIRRVSVDGLQRQSNDFSISANISADGRTISFSSLADNLVDGDKNTLAGDIFVVSNPFLPPNAGVDTVQASISHTLGLGIEYLTLTGTAAINGTGNNLNNILTGNSAANVLNGGTGVDQLRGGLGNDTYVLNDGDTITEYAGQGTDTVWAAISHTLGSSLENMTLTGTGNTNGTGNTLNNILTGNSGNNILNGGAGADRLTGGAGKDAFRFDSSATGVDTILDYRVVDDRIEFANAQLKNLVGPGSLNSTFFRASASGNAADRNDFLLYDTDSGNLYYDRDGSGAASKVLFATIGTSTHPAMTAGEFVVV